MRILHLSSSDLAGGAARAAFRLHQGLRFLDVDSRMYVSLKKSLDPHVSQVSLPNQLPNVVSRKFLEHLISTDLGRYRTTRPRSNDYFSDPRSSLRLDWRALLNTADVINLHWVAKLVDYESFFRAIPADKPVVWTMHDMNPFTGGCHYTDGCRKFEQACGACPQLGSNKLMDLAAVGFNRKMRAFAHLHDSQLVIVTPSHWLGLESRRSLLLSRFQHYVIPYGLDLNSFAPIDQASARRILGIDCNEKVLLFVSPRLGDRRKGMDLMIAALELLPEEVRPLILTVGRGESMPTGFRHHALGTLHDDVSLRLAYCSADVFVAPSRQDNLPNTVLEAIACGTPSIAFDIGGMSEMIVPNMTGLLAVPENPGDLARRLEELLSNPELRESMRINCRETAERHFSLKRQAKAYSDLYADLINMSAHSHCAIRCKATLSKQ